MPRRKGAKPLKPTSSLKRTEALDDGCATSCTAAKQNIAGALQHLKDVLNTRSLPVDVRVQTRTLLTILSSAQGVVNLVAYQMKPGECLPEKSPGTRTRKRS